ncbi:hypothetical protein H2200_008041 [Cladophialophora chaetospira]|uniref:Endo-1,4-beta-xylanase n=1 Tax=Cladophialophora chaetospira TaxID=386627 RepID=A0AA39CH18_9EURO|nr:hypothetical protein H2200_008041 [Cladophialophora chaetospira]
MFSIKSILLVLAGAAATVALPFDVATRDPGTLVERDETLTTSGTGTYGGYYYSLYIQNNCCTTFKLGTGTYDVSWASGAEDVVAGIGWQTGSTSRVLTYTAKYGATGDTLIALYGWSTNPLVEYYVIDYVGTYNPCSGGTQLGQVTSDGGTYNICETTRTNAPSIQGTATFHQYISVRTSNRLGGTITFANHVKAWASHGLNLGAMNYQILATEGYESNGETVVTITSHN